MPGVKEKFPALSAIVVPIGFPDTKCRHPHAGTAPTPVKVGVVSVMVKPLVGVQEPPGEACSRCPRAAQRLRLAAGQQIPRAVASGEVRCLRR